MKKSKNLLKNFLVSLLIGAAATSVNAEKADRQKPINITSDRGSEDHTKQEAIFEGNVVLTQGTLRVDANRIVIKRDKEGFDYASAFGNPAKFRQKRDDSDEYVEGVGQRIEYNGKTDIVQLFEKAKLNRGKDELSSNYIQYNSRTETYQAFNPGQKSTSETGERVKAVIQPKSKE